MIRMTMMVKRLIYEVGKQTMRRWWPISTSLCNKVRASGGADWPKVNLGSETKIGDKGKVICLFCRHFTARDTPRACKTHMVLTNRRVFASLAQRKTIPIFKFVKFRNSQNTVFCFPPASKQILLRSQCWLEHVFVVYLISSLNQTYGGHKPGFKRMSRRRNIYFGEAGGQTVFHCLNGNICKKYNNQYIIKY